MQNNNPLFRLPQKSSFRSNSYSGFLKKFLIVFISLALIFLSTGATLQVLAQTPQTVISVNDGLRTYEFIGIVGGYQRSLKINLSNFSDPDGLAAFSFKLKYHPVLFPIADANGDGKSDPGQVTVGSFLGSSGKQVSCSDGYIGKDPTDSTWKILNFSCVTLGPTPAGPTGSGNLATINITTGNTLSSGILYLISSELVDNTLSTNLVPHTAPALVPIYILRCANFDTDGVVTILDILNLAQKFSWNPSTPGWDPKYDLDGNNVVSILDILLAAKEFSMVCP